MYTAAVASDIECGRTESRPRTHGEQHKSGEHLRGSEPIPQFWQGSELRSQRISRSHDNATFSQKRRTTITEDSPLVLLPFGVVPKLLVPRSLMMEGVSATGTQVGSHSTRSRETNSPPEVGHQTHVSRGTRSREGSHQPSATRRSGRTAYEESGSTAATFRSTSPPRQRN